MDLSMRLDLPTPASPSTSTFKLTRLSKIFSRVMFVIGWRRHSHLVQAKHQNLDQVLVTEETTDPLALSAQSARSSPPALGAELHTGGAGCTNAVAIGTDDQRLPIYFFIGYCWWWWCCCFLLYCIKIDDQRLPMYLFSSHIVGDDDDDDEVVVVVDYCHRNRWPGASSALLFSRLYL